MPRRAVFTGLGVLSPMGLDLASFWNGLIEGRSGVKPISLFDASEFSVKIAGELPGFDAKSFFEKKDRKSLKMMARPIQIGVGCANVCMKDAGMERGKIDPTRFGIEFGSSMVPTEVEDLISASQAAYRESDNEVDLKKWGTESIPTLSPLWMLKFLPNMVACHVSILHDAQGPNNSITETDAAGLLAIGEAFRILRRDQADFFLCGGADSKLNVLELRVTACSRSCHNAIMTRRARRVHLTKLVMDTCLPKAPAFCRSKTSIMPNAECARSMASLSGSARRSIPRSMALASLGLSASPSNKPVLARRRSTT